MCYRIIFGQPHVYRRPRQPSLLPARQRQMIDVAVLFALVGLVVGMLLCTVINNTIRHHVSAEDAAGQRIEVKK